MTTIEVKQKSVLASGMTNQIVQGEHNAETFCFHFASPDSRLTTDLTYQLVYVRQDQKGTNVTLSRTETSDGFNLIWQPDVQATLVAGKFAFLLLALDSDLNPVWKSATTATYILPALNPAYPVDPEEEGVTYQDLFRDLEALVKKSIEGYEEIKESLENYSLTSETGYKLDLEIDPNTYVVTPKLYNKEGDLISTGKSIDLPMESAIVSITYDAKTNSLILTLRDGKTTTVPLSGLIEGLATEKWVEDKGYLTDQSLSEYRKSADQDKIDADKVSKVEGSSLVPDTKIASYDEHIVDSDIHVTTDDKTAWNAKYDKPSTGIPKADLATDVKTSLEKADSALQKDALTSYSLVTDTGYKLDLEIDSETFVITPKMYDKNGTLISTGKTVDLPLESVVVSGSYDSENKKIVLTLKNGSTVDVPVGDLISGLATQSWVEGKGYLVASDIVNKVDKVDGSSLVPDTKVAEYDTHVADGTIHVTSDNKSAWNAKYDKPTSGIPKTDLASEVQTSLGKADSAIQSIKTINNQSLVGSGNIILLSTSDEALN